MSEMDVLLGWIERTCKPAARLLVPVSGGSDSALCFYLLSQVYPDKTVGVHAGKEIQEQSWFERIGKIEFVETPGDYSEREEMRWGRFLALSLERRAWMVGCRNRTEQTLGTYSLASRVATILPLVGTWKSDVLALCREVGVPKGIIASSLRADPDCGRPQSLSEIPYDVIERFLCVKVGEAAKTDLMTLSSGQLEYLEKMYIGNAFKRGLPILGPTVQPSEQG